ncbi:MAG TPA: hypothetical protein VJ242_01565 [Patescibacteria group bacterium]|nr:hypothetical protein [Patescibacteria group bacterium]
MSRVENLGKPQIVFEANGAPGGGVDKGKIDTSQLPPEAAKFFDNDGDLLIVQVPVGDQPTDSSNPHLRVHDQLLGRDRLTLMSDEQIAEAKEFGLL